MPATDRPIRVALLAPTLAPAGGLCRWSRELVRGLEMVTTPDELAIHVLCRSSTERARQTIEEFDLRCQAHDINIHTATPKLALRSIRQVGGLLEEIKPDVVYTPLDWLWLLADRRRTRPKIIATAHAAPSPDTINRWNRMLARRLAKRGALRLTTSSPSLQGDLDRTIGVPAGTSLVMPVGTELDTEPSAANNQEPTPDLREHLEIHPQELIVLTLARLVSGKRVDLVLDVVELARRDDLAIRFVVCGDGPELEGLAREAERREMQGWVHFLGHVAHPEKLLRQADVVLNTSQSEGGMPFALIEALLAGTPVVATAAGGVRDLLADPRDGTLVPTGDINELYGAVCEALGREAGRDSDRASRAQARFSIERMGRAYWELISGVATVEQKS